MIKVSADGDSEAQREEQQPQVPAKEGAHYLEYFSNAQCRGSVQVGGRQQQSGEPLHIPAAKPFTSAGRWAVA